jgi:hypothetical protein
MIAVDEARAQQRPRDWFDALMTTRRDVHKPARPGDPHAIGSVPAVRASIATAAEELHAAADLVRRRYAWRGYGDVCEGPACACARDGCEHRVTLIASDADAVIGTLTLGLDSQAGLLVDDTYRDEVDALRAQGRHVCELTRFAVDADADSRAVLTSLFGLAYLLGRALNNATDVLVEVNPRHVAFYRRILGFCVASAEQVCARVKAPAVLLRLEIEELERRLMAMGCLDRCAA